MSHSEATLNRITRLIVGLLLASTVLAALLSTGCGGSDEGAPGTTGPTTTAIAATTISTTTISTTTISTTSGEPLTTAAIGVVSVYFSTGDGTDCGEVTAFERVVDTSIGPARAAFQELVGGPTEAEQAAGASSFFSSDTAGAVRSVSLTAGVLDVDFNDIRAEITNAGSSCGSAAFTSGLNATAFQFSTVDAARYLFAGSCEDFGGFIQTDSCQFERTE